MLDRVWRMRFELLSFAATILMEFLKVHVLLGCTKMGLLTLLGIVQELLSRNLDGSRHPVLDSRGSAVLHGLCRVCAAVSRRTVESNLRAESDRASTARVSR